MATSKEELKHENEQQIVQLVGDTNISTGDVKEKGMLVLSAFRNREEELMQNKMEVMEKAENHLRQVEEEAEIWKDTESPDQMKKEIDLLSEEFESLVFNCNKKEKEYKESIEAIESFGQLIEACFEFNNEEVEPTETSLLEMRSGAEVNDDQETELEPVKENNEMIPLNYEAEQEEESQLISSKSEIQKEEIENAELKHSSKMDGLRRSKRNVKDPFWMKDYIVPKDKGKGKGKGKK